MWATRARLNEIEERLHKAERELSSMKLEWEDVQEKVARSLRRNRQAVVDLQKRDEEAEESPTSEGDGTAQGFLTPRQKAVQQSILRQRGAVRGREQ